MSNKPKSFGFKLPTGQVLSPEFFMYQAYFTSNSSDWP
jgi:hypothetical protein